MISFYLNCYLPICNSVFENVKFVLILGFRFLILGFSVLVGLVWK